jgi:UDP-glucose 4-epimerase
LSADLSGARVLVTGGLGFLGLNLVPALQASGASVRILSRTMDPLAMSWLDGLRDGSSIEALHGDIADSDRMTSWLDGVDLVINLAGESGAVKSLREAQSDMHVNIAGHLSLLDALRQRPSPPRTLFMSSRLVYGVTGHEPVGEDHPQRPTSLYGLHKLTVEHYYRIYYQHYDVPYTILRLTNPYGPFQLPRRTQYGVINGFVMTALRGGTIQLYGGGQQLRDYIHARDVASAVLRASIDPSAVGQVFNVGAGESVSLGDMARLIVDVVGCGQIQNVPWPEHYRQVETGDFVCDTSRIQRILGWRPEIDLERGLRQTVESYRSLLG